MRERCTREGRENDLYTSTFDATAVVSMEKIKVSAGFQPR